MAYTIHSYFWDCAQLEAYKALLHYLIDTHRTAVFFAEEQSRLLTAIAELDARIKRYENMKGNR